ncbi:MAG TPA: type II secretion system F family protein [Kofleriaceae bacterium]|jgi:type IV pilus assembly protein PilC|nr:type II secretion system F family protein [Kofleriaceae bacterium]
MAKFTWEATSRSGDVKRGTMEAADEAAVVNRLRADQLTPKRIKKQAKQITITIGSGVTPKELQVFTRQLATMIDAGLPLVQCLDILAGQQENRVFASTLYNIKSSVEQGATFSDALRKHPKIFDELYVNLVAAGEIGGILDTILTRLATYIEKNVKLRGQLKSAMVYPTVILVVAIGVIAVMLGKVIPTFEKMYKEFPNAKLPKPTQFVIDLSDGFVSHWYVWLGLLAGIAVLLSLGLKTEKGRDILDRSLLRVPLVGPVLRRIVVARFTRTLGTLLSSGVPILDALDICAKTAGNRVVMRAILYSRNKISEGQDMAGPLGETRVFPTMVTQMIGVGEQTGAMDQMLQKIADFYEDEVDAAIGAMTKAIEPVMMAFLGVVVGGLIIAMYLPVFELAGNIEAG